MTQKIYKKIIPPNSVNIGNGISLYDTVLPQQLIKMHWHDFYEFEIILEGSGEVSCNNKTYPIKPGLLSMLSPTDFHEFRITSEIHVLCIQFTAESISKEILALFYNLESNIIYCDEKQIERTVSLFKLLQNNFITSASAKMYLSRLLETLLLSFKDDFKTILGKYDHSPGSIQKALVYINSHFKENPKMSDIAKMLFLNEHYFCSLFKENMGESYKNYLRKIKLNYAANLIQHTDIPVTQISLDSGYSSQSNFNRDFKAFFGISPSAIRKNKKYQR